MLPVRASNKVPSSTDFQMRSTDSYLSTLSISRTSEYLCSRSCSRMTLVSNDSFTLHTFNPKDRMLRARRSLPFSSSIFDHSNQPMLALGCIRQTSE